MKEIYLVNYSVNGIKTIDKTVSLSFYKKTFQKDFDTQEYNIKGIYGMNGSGKTGIIASVDILKKLLITPDYLNNLIIQTELDEIINKKTQQLSIEADFVVNVKAPLPLFRYNVVLSRDYTGKYVISKEQLSFKNANTRTDKFNVLFQVTGGVLTNFFDKADSEFVDFFKEKTMNLLSSNSVSALFFEKVLTATSRDEDYKDDTLFWGIFSLFVFGTKLHVFLDQSDNHSEYIIQSSYNLLENIKKHTSQFNKLMKQLLTVNMENLNVFTTHRNIVPKNTLKYFENTVHKLCDFLRIFKSDLKDIEVEKKEDNDVYICSLIMVYDAYRIHSEFESTGIKKLITLFAYLTEMVQGGIVFIDEFDSNLHDVYLCALLEYLMEYGEGQLCFTTHNVGPMDILKKNKKSIDFLSVDHKIYPWTSNGNYSPSKLYRNGMIEGSPFNVDSIDFIKAFHIDEEDDA